MISPKQTKAKCFLINPTRGQLPPIGLLCLAAVLEREDCEVKIVELTECEESEYLEKNAVDINNILKENPTFIGISCLTASRNETLHLVQHFKERAPKIPIVLGGRHPSSKFKDALDWGADYVVVGEGEDALIELLNYLLGRTSELEKIGGLAYKVNGSVHYSGQRKAVDLSALPFPSYYLIDYDAYVGMKFNSIRGRYVRGGIVLTGRGCIGRCTFCYTDLMHKRIRNRPISDVMDEIQFQIERYKLDAMYILDDTFTMSERRVAEFCKEKKNRGIKAILACQARVDTFTDHMAKDLKEAGFVQVEFGVESGSQRVLDTLKKGVTVEQIERAFDICKKHGLASLANIMIGCPGEYAEDIELTKKLLLKIQPNATAVSFMTPFPGTELFQQSLDNKWLVDEDSINYKQMGDDPSLCINFTKEELFQIRNELYAIAMPSTYMNMLKNPSFLIDMIKLVVRKPRFILDFLNHTMHGRNSDAINLFKNELINSAFK